MTPRSWKAKKSRSRAERLVILVQLEPSDLHPEAAVLAGGWACPHVVRRLGGPINTWGEKDKNWSIGPLRNWSASNPLVDPAMLCGRCTKKRNGDGFDFTTGDYPTAKPEDL